MTCQHPGKVLIDQYIQPLRLSQNKLAKALLVSPRRINEIVLGKRAITADTAVRLGAYFGNSASYWMHIQAEYDISQAKEKMGQRLFMIQASHDNESATTQNQSTPIDSIKTSISDKHQDKSVKRRLMR